MRKLLKEILQIVILGVVFYFTDTTCLWRKITGIPCPTCGVTRALMSLLRMDFQSYIYYNCMAVPLVIATFLLLFCREENKLFKSIGIIILCFNIPYYLFRLIYNLIL